jgi:MFS family permease
VLRRLFIGSFQETLQLTPLEITLIFDIYSLTMVAAFLTVARLSDFVGRTPMIFAALMLNALALGLFIEANTSTVLMVVRAVQGVATGIALATLGAWITDAALKAAGTLNSVTAFIGMTVGALAAGSFVAYLPSPTQLVFRQLDDVHGNSFGPRSLGCSVPGITLVNKSQGDRGACGVLDIGCKTGNR